MPKITLDEALAKLPRPDGKRFANMLHHGTLDVEIYAPRGADPQQPHSRDELYVVMAGRGTFVDLFDELVHFTRVFPHPRLALEVVLVEIEEWRYPGHGRRRWIRRGGDGDTRLVPPGQQKGSRPPARRSQAAGATRRTSA